MTPAQFETALRAFWRRRPFRASMLEFTSGHQVLSSHPEAIGPKGDLDVLHSTDGGYVLFAAESVSRLLDTPIHS